MTLNILSIAYYYCLLVLVLLLLHSSTTTAHGIVAFQAKLVPLADNTVVGRTVVFADGPKVAFAGTLTDAPANLTAPVCTAKNGCGVHVHTGTDCTNTTTQGGHYYNAATVETDPWLEVRYESDGEGGASFAGVLDVGEDATLEGRAFLGTCTVVVCC